MASSAPSGQLSGGVRGANSVRGFDPRDLPVLPTSSEELGLPAIAHECLQPERLVERFREPRVDWQPEIISDQRAGDQASARAAAVLVPIVSHAAGVDVLLTVRPDHLRAHAGQIAFPGGAVEAHDDDRLATALREAEEEVGLEIDRSQVIGQLPAYRTGTGFEVTPVVAVIDAPLQLTIDPNEVAETFEVPLAFLMDPRQHRRHQWGSEPNSRIFYSMPWRRDSDNAEFFIWGVTAAILRNLYHFLRA
ncbi:MAG: CoA pyrophosphatase [Burkholderiaceae bacterium]